MYLPPTNDVHVAPEENILRKKLELFQRHSWKKGCILMHIMIHDQVMIKIMVKKQILSRSLLIPLYLEIL